MSDKVKYTDNNKIISVRAQRFQLVCDKCVEHIETYTVPQYGDYPNDQLTNMTLAEIRHDLQRYVNRMGRSSRGFEDSMRDMLKFMHYAAEAYLIMAVEHQYEGMPNED